MPIARSAEIIQTVMSRSVIIRAVKNSKLRIRKARRKIRRRPGNLFCFAPDNVFVISAVDEGIDFVVGVVTEEDPAFDAFAEKEIASFREQLFLFVQLFLFAFAFDE